MNETIILRERVITIGAGDTFDQSLQGNVLRVTAGNVPLRVQDRDQQMDFTLLAGERAEFPGEFPGLILSHNSGIDQTFTIQVGKGVNVASALVSGTVTITGTPNVNIAGGNLLGITNAIKSIDDGNEYGATWASNTPMAGNTPATIISPAANLNGALVIASAFFCYVSGNTAYTSLIAKSTIPTSNTNGDVLAVTNKIEAGGYFSGGQLAKPIKITAGMGLYMLCNLTQTTFMANVVYKLL